MRLEVEVTGRDHKNPLELLFYSSLQSTYIALLLLRSSTNSLAATLVNSKSSHQSRDKPPIDRVPERLHGTECP